MPDAPPDDWLPPCPLESDDPTWPCVRLECRYNLYAERIRAKALKRTGRCDARWLERQLLALCRHQHPSCACHQACLRGRMSRIEVALVLGVSVTTVGNDERRAVAALVEVLREQDDG